MENNFLDCCVSIHDILTYFHDLGVISIYGGAYGHAGKIHLDDGKFRDLFPDVVPDDTGYAKTEYKGVEVVAIFPQEIKP